MSGSSSFCDALFARLPAQHALHRVALADLEQALGHIYDQMSAVFPELEVTGDELIEFVAGSVAIDWTTPDDIRRVPVADLKLAIGCCIGKSAALELFESKIIPTMKLAVTRIDPSGGDLTDEALQRAREKLLINGKMSTYQARGPLAAFGAVVASREALMLLRQQRREVPLEDEPLLSLAAVEFDPVQEEARQKFRSEIETALTTALAALEVRSRSIIRYAFIHKLSLAKIAVIYGVHKTTVFRWLSDAREALLAGMSAELSERFPLDASQIASAVRLVRSQVDVSLERVLGEEVHSNQ